MSRLRTFWAKVVKETGGDSRRILDEFEEPLDDELAYQEELEEAQRLPTVIDWNNPADITYGEALSALHLNAVITEGDGELDYSANPIGTKLDVGDAQTLTVTVEESDVYEAASKTVAINVKPAKPEIEWSNPADITYGDLLSATQLSAVLKKGEGALDYSANATGAKLNGGDAQELKVTLAATKNYEAGDKTVKINVKPAKPEIEWSNPADITYGDLLSATQLNAVLKKGEGTLDYSANAIGAKLNGGAAQDLKVTLAASKNYEAGEKTVKINVKPAKPEIEWSNPADITYGDLLSATQLNAVLKKGEGTLDYSANAIGTKLNGGAAQDLKVTVAASKNYEAGEKIVKINVKLAKPEIEWSNPADITYGDLLSATQLNAVLKKGEGALEYSANAIGAKLNGGDAQDLKVTVAATKNYDKGEKTVKVNVKPAKPVIEWSDPAPMVHGQALSATQLNAVRKHGDGVLKYTPASGTAVACPGPNPVTMWLRVEHEATRDYSVGFAQVRLCVYMSAQAQAGYNSTVNGSAWKAPTTGAEAAVVTDWNNDVNGMKTQGQELMKKFRGMTGDEIKAHMDSLTSPADRAFQGGTYPNHIWKLPNGLQIRYKPGGDNFNPGVPMFCIEARKTPGFTANQNDIVFKLSLDGNPTAKGPSNTDLNLPPGLTNVQQAHYRSGSCSSTHLKCKSKENQVLEWSNPSDITEGTALSDVQLNARLLYGNGALTYAPVTGSVLAKGAGQPLTVNAAATPGFNTASKSVQINVKEKPKT